MILRSVPVCHRSSYRHHIKQWWLVKDIAITRDCPRGSWTRSRQGETIFFLIFSSNFRWLFFSFCFSSVSLRVSARDKVTRGSVRPPQTTLVNLADNNASPLSWSTPLVLRSRPPLGPRGGVRTCPSVSPNART